MSVFSKKLYVGFTINRDIPIIKFRFSWISSRLHVIHKRYVKMSKI